MSWNWCLFNTFFIVGKLRHHLKCIHGVGIPLFVSEFVTYDVVKTTQTIKPNQTHFCLFHYTKLNTQCHNIENLSVRKWKDVHRRHYVVHCLKYNNTWINFCGYKFSKVFFKVNPIHRPVTTLWFPKSIFPQYIGKNTLFLSYIGAMERVNMGKSKEKSRFHTSKGTTCISMAKLVRWLHKHTE